MYIFIYIYTGSTRYSDILNGSITVYTNTLYSVSNIKLTQSMRTRIYEIVKECFDCLTLSSKFEIRAKLAGVVTGQTSTTSKGDVDLI